MRVSRLKFLMATALFFFTVSCSKDDDNSQPYEAELMIVGSWNVDKDVEMYYDETTDSFNDSSVTEMIPGQQLIEFTADYKVYNQFTYATTVYNDTGSYSFINDAQFRFTTSSGQAFVYTVASISDSNMHIFSNYRYSSSSDSVESHLYLTR